MENVKSCSLAELENMEQETYQLLDIRSMEAFDHGHLKDALNIPANELIERKDELQTEKKILKRASAKNTINLFSANLQKQSMNISLSGKEIKLLSVFPAERIPC